MPAGASAAWPHLFLPGPGPVVIALHGTGGSESDAAPLAQFIAPDAAIIAPRGRVLEHGASRWFRRLTEGVFDVDDVVAQANDLAAFIETVVREHSLEGRPVIATGFSNGANMGLALAVLHPELVTSVVAFSGMYPLADRDVPNELSGSRFVLFNGTDDAMAPLPSVNRLNDQLTQRGADVDQRLRPGGHGLSQEEATAAQEWFAAAF